MAAAPKRWPELPALMSVSLLSELEACPRRWALSAAEYPEIWEGHGYPRRLQLATAGGSVVHMAVEELAKALVRARCPSAHSPESISVMRSLGGFSKLLRSCIDRVLVQYEGNPRTQDTLERAKIALDSKIPDMRAHVQAFLADTRLEAAAETAREGPSEGTRHRSELALGTHPEVELKSSALEWRGFADLVTLSTDSCEITDFKTGAPSEHHVFQVQVYALLWSKDADINPTGRLAEKFTVAYPKGSESVDALDASELVEFERELSQRTEVARSTAMKRPPPARPSVDTCQYCSVRHLCEEYWTPETQSALSRATVSDTREDFEALIIGRHGPTSWDVEITGAANLPRGHPGVIRTSLSALELDPHSIVRVLDGYVTSPAESSEPAVITLNAGSEIYRVGS